MVIIGGGIAGLTATILPSRMEKFVTAMERSSELGGRVRASLVCFYLNQGPQAMYSAGSGVRILRKLDSNYVGSMIDR